MTCPRHPDGDGPEWCMDCHPERYEQYGFDSEEESQPEGPKFYADQGLTIQERFERFDRENPMVWEVLLRLARQARSHGAKKLGVRTLWEVMRWEVFMRTRDPSGLKLNDHYHSRYVRKLVREYPDEFGEFFELRTLRAP